MDKNNPRELTLEERDLFEICLIIQMMEIHNISEEEARKNAARLMKDLREDNPRIPVEAAGRMLAEAMSHYSTGRTVREAIVGSEGAQLYKTRLEINTRCGWERVNAEDLTEEEREGILNPEEVENITLEPDSGE